MTHLFIESISAYPNTCELCVRVRGGENAELSQTVWFHYRNSELTPDPVNGNFDGEMSVLKFLIMHKMATAVFNQNQQAHENEIQEELNHSVFASSVSENDADEIRENFNL